MSRSYKHNAILKDSNKYNKKQANKRVRKTVLANGGNYKKAYESYNICDWRYVYGKRNNIHNGQDVLLEFIRK